MSDGPPSLAEQKGGKEGKKHSFFYARQALCSPRLADGLYTLRISIPFHIVTRYALVQQCVRYVL
jgi:hypothetical protein